MFGNRIIKFPGLDGNQVTIWGTMHVLFIEETMVGNVRAANIHFDNGRWVSVVASADEVGALLTAEKSDLDERQEEKWRADAKARRLAKQREFWAMSDYQVGRYLNPQKEVADVMRALDFHGEPKQWSTETAEDGSRKIVAYLPPGNYEALDRAFEEAAARLKAESQAAPQTPAGGES